MAVWQFHLYARVPSDGPFGWSAWPGLPKLDGDLQQLFGRAEPMFEDSMAWGDDQRHDAKLSLHDEEDVDLHIRLDVRWYDRSLLERLTDVLRASGLQIVAEGELLEADVETIERLIKASRANLFVTDPARWLDTAKEHTITNPEGR